MGRTESRFPLSTVLFIVSIPLEKFDFLFVSILTAGDVSCLGLLVNQSKKAVARKYRNISVVDSIVYY
ncbi:MAG: hypothetical protein KME05_04145 [Gloeocapsa sp. UFS-A4-WI-NPMV-4B04]|nr:hypothetical protein [Gloeocapsa sp. UFS-A4-WI-NPMV-4B04]